MQSLTFVAMRVGKASPRTQGSCLRPAILAAINRTWKGPSLANQRDMILTRKSVEPSSASWGTGDVVLLGGPAGVSRSR